MNNIFEKNSLTLILLKIFDINLYHYFATNKHSDACIYLPPYKLDILKIVEYKFSCEMEAHVEVTSLMFDCNTFKDKRHLLILVAISLPSKELQFCCRSTQSREARL